MGLKFCILFNKKVFFLQMLHNGSLQSNTPAYSARTRPFSKSGFRKRKLIQTTGLHALSKKAGRPSNIRCSCVEPMTPCALCTGRADPTFPRDMPEQLTTPERVALLDPGYHPVLSFPEGKITKSKKFYRFILILIV